MPRFVLHSSIPAALACRPLVLILGAALTACGSASTPAPGSAPLASLSAGGAQATQTLSEAQGWARNDYIEAVASRPVPQGTFVGAQTYDVSEWAGGAFEQLRPRELEADWLRAYTFPASWTPGEIVQGCRAVPACRPWLSGANRGALEHQQRWVLVLSHVQTTATTP